MFPNRTQIRNFIYNIFLEDANNLNECINACNNNEAWAAANNIFNALVQHFDLPNEFMNEGWRRVFVEHFTHHLNDDRNVTEITLKRRAQHSSWFTINKMVLENQNQQ